MLSDEEQTTLNSYNSIATDWSAKNSDPDFWKEEFTKFSLFLPAGKILDVGCGTGRDSEYFTQHGYEYYGIDASEKMLSIASETHPGVMFYLQNFYELQFADESFDGFWAAASLLHVPKEKVSQPLEEINRVCKPGAIGFIGIKEGEGMGMVEWEDMGQERFYAYYSYKEFSDILEQAGFEVMEASKKVSLADPAVNFLVFYLKKS